MNTNAKHTPGPWEFYPSKDQDGDSTLSIRGNAEFIATMDTQSINGGPFKLPPNGEANARLIAKAPDMFSAIQDIISSAQANDANSLAEAINHAAATISQAEGGAQ